MMTLSLPELTDNEIQAIGRASRKYGLDDAVISRPSAGLPVEDQVDLRRHLIPALDCGFTCGASCVSTSK